MQLLPSPIPGEEPRTLPQNIVIDFDNSVLPPTWGSPGAITAGFDVLFSPNGTVTGTCSGRSHPFRVLRICGCLDPAASPPATTSGVPLMDIRVPGEANANYTAQTSWVVPNPQNDLASSNAPAASRRERSRRSSSRPHRARRHSATGR